MQRIPNYSIIRTIGHGVFGYVFEAWDVTNQKKVAIKRVQKKSTKLSREYEVLMALQGCPNIIQLEDFYYTKNDENEFVQNMVFAYMESNLENVLRHHILNKKYIEENTLKLYMYQILNGLCQMHSRDICHRDLKPENILIDNKDQIRICDLGSAKFLNEQSLNTPYVVTQYYRAPELLLSHSDYNTSIDIWAAGCIFFELASLNIMFEGKFEGDQLFKILEILGTPDKETQVYLVENLSYKPQIQKKLQGYEPKELSEFFSHLSYGTQLLELILSMVQINPKRRITALEALHNPIFIW